MESTFHESFIFLDKISGRDYNYLFNPSRAYDYHVCRVFHFVYIVPDNVFVVSWSFRKIILAKFIFELGCIVFLYNFRIF